MYQSTRSGDPRVDGSCDPIREHCERGMRTRGKILPPALTCVLLWTISVGVTKAETVTVTAPDRSPPIDFALERLEHALAAQQIALTVSPATHGDASSHSISLHGADNPHPDCDDGFCLRKNGADYAIHAESDRGMMYGILDLVSQLENGTRIDSLEPKVVRAHVPFRAIKFNLPWYSYRDGENLALHTETCRDLEFWRAFLDMMVENKFNVLSLWNMHPYIFILSGHLGRDALQRGIRQARRQADQR